MFIIPAFRSVTIIAAMSITGALSSSAFSTVVSDNQEIVMTTKRLDGPRLGVSVIGSKPIYVNGREVGPILSQFGWQFEWMVRPEGGGPAFVTEIIPFIGGVEYSIIVPSLSLVTGIRFPQGVEFGMGPHVAVHFNDNDKPLRPSLILAIGHTFDFSGVNIPLNLAMTNNSDGQSFSFVFGYAIPSVTKN